MSRYIKSPVARKKCKYCHTNTDTYQINHIQYKDIYGRTKVKKLPSWENWCMKCIKEKQKELGW